MMSNLPFANFNPVRNGDRVFRGSPSPEGPVRVVVDSINAPTLKVALMSYAESGIVPHFTIDFGGSGQCESVLQHLDLGESAIGVSDMPVEPHRIGRTIWVMVLKPSGLVPCTSQSFWLGQTIGKIVENVGAFEYWETFPTRSSAEYRGVEMSFGAWREFSGVCAAAHVPQCSRYGPGEMDLWSFGEGLSSPAASLPSNVVVERVEAAPELAEPTVVELLKSELEERPKVVAVETVLGKFPGRRIQIGSGGKAVDTLREAYGLGAGKFDEELQDHVIFAQEIAGVTADGVVDSSVWIVLDGLLVEEAATQD